MRTIWDEELVALMRTADRRVATARRRERLHHALTAAGPATGFAALATGLLALPLLFG